MENLSCRRIPPTSMNTATCTPSHMLHNLPGCGTSRSRTIFCLGTPYDEERYHAVVECCALKPDLDILEDGDQTEIGARYASFKDALALY